MSLFDRFQKGVDAAKFKANQLNRINKLNNDIAYLISEISNIRKQIIDTTLLLYRSNGELPSQLSQLCTQIADLETKINGIELSINLIRQEHYSPDHSIAAPLDEDGLTCQHCDKDIPALSEFCIYCGKKL